jgi:cytochrome o ubiquinol oxidase operon protein cyoD
MSAVQSLHADHAGSHHDDHDDIGYHATVKGYVRGFALSVLLTAIPFWLVMSGVLPAMATGFIVLGFAAVQVIVHMVYFLHLDTKVEGGWSLLALLFTGVLVAILLSGSVWVMFHLNANMMPMDAHTMRSMP